MASASSSRRYIGTKESVLYGIANGGQCLGYSFLTSYITYFFVNVFHVNPRYVALMLGLEGIWDTINDPLMGAVVDKTRTRYGKLRPYLLGVPIPLGITTILLFAGPLIVTNPSPNAASKVIYMTATYLIWEFFYTIGDVPFWGLSTAVSPNPDDRTRAITSARFISGIIGGLPGIAMPILIDMSNSASGFNLKNVFGGMGLLAGTIGMGLFALSGIFVKERVVHSEEEPSLRDCVNQIVKNPPLRLIILKEFLMAFSGIGGIYSNYYFIDVLGSASSVILTGILSTVVGFAAFMVVPLFKQRFNNRQLVILSPVFQSVVNGFTYLAGMRNYSNMKVMIPLLMLNNALPAIFNGVNGVVPTEMIGETVDYMEWTTGQRNEGVSFSVLTFVGKLSGAISRSVASYTLSLPWLGYKTSPDNAIVPQTATTKSRIWFMYMASPVLLRFIGVIPMFFYDLVGDKRQRMLDELAVRRADLMHEVSTGGADAEASETAL